MAIDTRELERLQYWQGQTLRSRDFRDQSRFDERRRRLHNRALHSTDGVNAGLGVTRATDDLTRVEVACGVGYDCHGRELWLQRPRRIATPAEPSWLILRVRAESASVACCPEPDPGCTADETRQLDNSVELAWVRAGSLEPINGIVLARWITDIDAAWRPRQSRPLARPRLARGQTVRGNTPWEPWIVDEPDGQGGIRRKVVGVETHIDTTAAGFTRTPCYFASLESPAWDVATAEFAPAFFPSIADPSIDGFTFRLLMVETTRRRYSSAFGVASVTKTTRGLGDVLHVHVDSATPFQQGDPISLLRPRARSVVRIDKVSGTTLTLSETIEALEEGESELAIGNFPRTAIVKKITPASTTMVAPFTATPAVKKNDILLRTTDNAMAIIDSTAGKKLTVDNPFPNWQTANPVQVARLTGAVKIATATPNGATTTFDLVGTHSVNPPVQVVVIDASKNPVGVPRTVSARNGQKVDVTPALTPAEINAADQVAAFAADITILSVQPAKGMELRVKDASMFAEGDIVAATKDTQALAAITKVNTATNDLTLDASFPVNEDDTIVAANLVGAVSVAGVGSPAKDNIVIARIGAVPSGAFVARRETDDSLSTPMVVTQVNGATLTVTSILSDLKRLDTLAIGVFPRIVTVLAQQPQQEQIQIVPGDAGLLRVGDEIAVVMGTATSTGVAQVAAVSANNVVLGSSLGTLTPGQQLAVVHFRHRAVLDTITSPTKIDIDRAIADDGDVIGVVTHYVDNSNPGYITRIDPGNVLVLGISGMEGGDGIVDADWIDSGVVGPATVTFTPDDPSLWKRQLVVRLATTEGLAATQSAVVYGLDLLSGRFVPTPVLAFDVTGDDRIFLWPPDPAARYRYRPETLSLITTFNTDFPSAFATFAQKQQLSVGWIGCQQEFPRPAGCLEQSAPDPCEEPGLPEV